MCVIILNIFVNSNEVSGLYYKSFTIVIYDCNDNALYYKTTIIANLLSYLSIPVPSLFLLLSPSFSLSLLILLNVVLQSVDLLTAAWLNVVATPHKTPCLCTPSYPKYPKLTNGLNMLECTSLASLSSLA
jgi:hypothetical protein